MLTENEMHREVIKKNMLAFRNKTPKMPTFYKNRDGFTSLSLCRYKLENAWAHKFTFAQFSAYSVAFTGSGILSPMEFIKLSVHLTGSTNFPFSAAGTSLAVSAGAKTPPRISPTSAYL